MATADQTAVEDGEAALRWRVRHAAFWLVGLLVVLMAGSARSQGNIDAGKTPAQMFADTCSTCHRRPQELKRASAGFLRQHYMSGGQEAAAMASYLAGVPRDARGAKAKERAEKAKERAEKAKERLEKARHQPQQPHETAHQQQAHDKGKTAPPPAKGRRAAELAKAAAEPPPPAETPPPEPSPAEAPREVSHVQEAPPVPKLEPFEE